jgi:hypothetical protein
MSWLYIKLSIVMEGFCIIKKKSFRIVIKTIFSLTLILSNNYLDFKLPTRQLEV